MEPGNFSKNRILGFAVLEAQPRVKIIGAIDEDALLFKKEICGENSLNLKDLVEERHMIHLGGVFIPYSFIITFYYILSPMYCRFYLIYILFIYKRVAILPSLSIWFLLPL